ncbi:hypothetical protein HDZ31DRAFT_61388 [Schizophyllum fasciatum]
MAIPEGGMRDAGSRATHISPRTGLPRSSSKQKMPFVNNKKYACESCIKGHRSSNCHHTDRPLFEVKKKGRPVSQCPKCRELRKTRKLHSKCSCAPGDAPEARTLLAPASASGKPRYMPIAPALPNGLRDVLQGGWVAAGDARQRVDALLNPCSCGGVRGCRCSSAQASTSAAASSSSTTLDGPSPPISGLNALAAAAASLSRQLSASAAKHPSTRPPSPKHKRAKVAHGSCCASRHDACVPTATATPISTPSPGPTLPPLLLSAPPPALLDMPRFTTLTSLAGSGCTCGVDCTCPGCTEHRGADRATRSHADCADGNCIHCVEGATARAEDSLFARSGGALGEGDVLGTADGAGSDALAQFFARAAQLPLPPNRMGQRVELPKLECCGGNCGCPDGRCGCGQTCDGCEEHALEHGHPVIEESAPPPPVAEAPCSCCSGKTAC